MTDNMNFEYLPLSDQGYVKGATGKVTTILMLVMRIKRESNKGVMANMKQQHTQFIVTIVDNYAL
ncbi:hypothetical protein RO3G_07880 [Rhizopus delemar RA 99-880]|uniref:Uncharacterized protein n=1 Tax=Rhizopus delemar (strain RA 99-880 / ATCC MYA-4621 / FGSC 9543 / NRRL 43880) TaxID=246409 RepID=I1C3Z5_RHIO9|nr:hypothetical protein RO3G_07880 [Rhizopus delemar RA 99-880]|eukprot:EIE83175.1 hypothetical protein RO3G_07880 [Rhizopus delemar RA 99-880]